MPTGSHCPVQVALIVLSGMSPMAAVGPLVPKKGSKQSIRQALTGLLGLTIPL